MIIKLCRFCFPMWKQMRMWKQEPECIFVAVIRTTHTMISILPLTLMLLLGEVPSFWSQTPLSDSTSLNVITLAPTYMMLCVFWHRTMYIIALHPSLCLSRTVGNWTHLFNSMDEYIQYFHLMPAGSCRHVISILIHYLVYVWAKTSCWKWLLVSPLEHLHI